MYCRRAPRILTAWLAVVALLMAAIAPTLSHAWSGQSDASWVEVCSQVGAKWVKVDDSGAEKAPGSGKLHPLEHCPYCSLHADAITAPAVAAVPLGLVHARQLTAAFLAAPRTLFAWVAAQPRAPPALS